MWLSADEPPSENYSNWHWIARAPWDQWVREACKVMMGRRPTRGRYDRMKGNGDGRWHEEGERPGKQGGLHSSRLQQQHAGFHFHFPCSSPCICVPCTSALADPSQFQAHRSYRPSQDSCFNRRSAAEGKSNGKASTNLHLCHQSQSSLVR